MPDKRMCLHLQCLITKVKFDEHLKGLKKAKTKFLCRYNTVLSYIYWPQRFQDIFPYLVVKKVLFLPSAHPVNDLHLLQANTPAFSQPHFLFLWS